MKRDLTPRNIAEGMTALIRVVNPRTIADYSAGTGVLLQHAKMKFPQTRMIYVEKDPTRSILCMDLGFKKVGTDFYLTPLNAETKASVILLNPPYEDEISGKYSSLLHIVRAYDFLHGGGQMIFIVHPDMLDPFTSDPFIANWQGWVAAKHATYYDQLKPISASENDCQKPMAVVEIWKK